jgi:acetylornithine deacetylase
MTNLTENLAALTADLVRIDSRSFVSNLPVAERVEEALAGFHVERVDYTDTKGVAKRALIAHRGPRGSRQGGLALSGHMDTVPDTGWTEDPWSARIDAAGVMHGLGSVDMKGPVAACILAAQGLPADVPATLLITTDEETTKAGARAIAQSEYAKALGLAGIVVAEPTGLKPIRGHRSSGNLVIRARGVQAHSSTGQGLNANWALIPFLMEMKGIYERLRTDPALQDPAYDPPFSDFNLVVDNHGTAVNVNVPLATVTIKFRRSASVDGAPIIAAARAAAERQGLEFEETLEGPPPELPTNHPLIRLAVAVSGQAAGTVPFGTDASELQVLAPCVVLGPGTIETAHTPRECVALADLAAAVPLFQDMLRQGAKLGAR